MNLKDYFSKAKRGHFSLGAFNAANLEVVKAIIQAAGKLSSPVIIESSPGETNYIEPENLDDLTENAKKKTKLPIFVNLDHGESIEAVQKAIKAGYEMVHFDGSLLPFEENVKLTKKAVVLGHAVGLMVEGELGTISGSSALHKDQNIKEVQSKGVLTDPDQAREFVRLTGVDVLATFVGNVHGLYHGEKKLDLPRLKTIGQKVNCFLSLHGGSGISAKEIRQAINCGVVKINVNTELRMAYKNTSAKVFAKSKEVAVYKLMPPVIEAVQKVVEEKMMIFGSRGKIER